MAFDGYSFKDPWWGLDTYGGEGGGFSAFGGMPEGYMPNLSGVPSAPPMPQRRPLTMEDLYQPAPQQEMPQMPDLDVSMEDLSPEAKRALRNQILLQAGMAISQGANSRGPGMAVALSEAAGASSEARSQALAMEGQRRQAAFDREQRMAQQEAAQRQQEAQGMRERTQAEAVAGMANRIAEAEPRLASLADLYAKLGQMDNLAELNEKLPSYAAARAQGFDPFEQPDWRELVEERRQQEQEAAKRAAELEEWKQKQSIQQQMENEQRQQWRSQGLLWEPERPREPRQPRYSVQERNGRTYRVNLDDPSDISEIPGLPVQEQRPFIISPEFPGEAPRLVDPRTGAWRTAPRDPAAPAPAPPPPPAPEPSWWESLLGLEEKAPAPKPKPSAQVDRGEGAPTRGGNAPAANKGGDRPSREPSPQQVEQKVAMVSQGMGQRLTPEQEAFVRAELRSGKTAQSVLARIRMAMQGGQRG